MEVCEATGKQAYRSEDHAKRVMRHLSASLRTYKCPRCGRWHLSKKNG